MSLLQHFPSELIINIYNSCSSINDVLSLSSTCRRLYALLSPSQKISVLLEAAEAEAGPIFDIVQLLSQNHSQPAHHIRQPTISYIFLEQIKRVSGVAKIWQDIYPQARWQEDFFDRRSLNEEERYRLRRAIYRLWLFSRAFHTNNYPRETRLQLGAAEERSRLLRNWPTDELAEIEDFRSVMRQVMSSTGHGSLECQFSLSPYFALFHCKASATTATVLPPATKARPLFHDSCDDRDYMFNAVDKIHCSLVTMDGWGDDITQYYLVEDLMKLDPGEALWFRENAMSKWHIQAYIDSLGEWFSNNGETFGQTFERVVCDRGDDVHEVREKIMLGELGIVRRK